MLGGAPVQGGGQRTSRKATGEEEEGLYQWRLGSRARAEVEERNVDGFICDFMKKSWLDEQEKLLGEDEEEEERSVAGRKGKSVVRDPEHPVEKETELKDIAEKYGEKLSEDHAPVAGSKLNTV